MEEEILSIREEHKDYGYRRIHGELLNKGCKINKKTIIL
ncbi:IS3 family transposase [Schnuerera ultunensis]